MRLMFLAIMATLVGTPAAASSTIECRIDLGKESHWKILNLEKDAFGTEESGSFQLKDNVTLEISRSGKPETHYLLSLVWKDTKTGVAIRRISSTASTVETLLGLAYEEGEEKLYVNCAPLKK